MLELASAWKTLGVSDLAEATGGVKRLRSRVMRR